MATVTCYDGVNCIGGNKILLECGDSRLFFEFGKNIGVEGSKRPMIRNSNGVMDGFSLECVLERIWGIVGAVLG